MFTDELVGLDIAHRSEMRRSTATAQSIIDEQAAHIARLQAKLAKAYAALEAEQARRIAAEMKYERLLDMPI